MLTPGVLVLLTGVDNEYDIYFNVWMDSKLTKIGVTLLMQMCWKYDVNAASWMNIGIEVKIVILWLYIGQHDDATRDGLVTSHVTSPRHVKFL